MNNNKKTKKQLLEELEKLQLQINELKNGSVEKSDSDTINSKQAEKVIRESEERYCTMIKNLPFAIMVFRGDGSLKEANESSLKLWGLSNKDIDFLLQQFNVLKDEENQLLGITPLFKRAFEGEFVSIPDQYYEPEHSSVTSQTKAKATWVRGIAYPIKNNMDEVNEVVLIYEDVTEQHVAQQALKEGEAKWRSLTQDSPDHIMRLDLDYRIQFINWTRDGYSADDVIGTSFLDYIEPKYQSVATDCFEQVKRTKTTGSFSCDYTTPSGENISYETKVSSILDKDKVVGLMTTSTDITQRKQTEEQRIAALEKAEKIQKRLLLLLNATSAVQNANSEREVLEIVASTVRNAGWKITAVYLFDDWQIVESAYVGLEDSEIAFLKKNRPNREQLKTIFTEVLSEFKISRSMFIPSVHKDKFAQGRPIRERIRRKLQGDNNWDHYDGLYIPLYGLNDEIIGSIGLDNPLDGQRPDEETCRYLESFADLIATTLLRMRLEKEREAATKALQESFEIINSSPAVAFRWRNVKGWPIDYVSENSIDLFGYSAEDFITGKITYNKVIHPDDLEKVIEEVKQYSNDKSRTDYMHKPYRIISKDGQVKWVDDWTNIHRDEKGEISHQQGIVLDITERKRAQEEREESLIVAKTVQDKLQLLLKATTEIQTAHDVHQTLEIVAKSVRDTGWESVVVRLFDNWEVVDSVFLGLELSDIEHLKSISPDPEERKAMYGEQRAMFKISKSYFIPNEELEKYDIFPSILESRRKTQKGDSWHPRDIAYVPMYNPDGNILGVITMDDPIDGQRPNEQTFKYLESFADLAAITLIKMQLETERALAAEAERKSAEKYRLVVDNTDTGFVVLNEEGIVVEANEPYMRLIGTENLDDTIGRSVIEWAAPECKEENAATVELCTKQGYIKDFETTCLRNDGTRVIILINSIMHETSEGKLLTSQCRDITERRKAEKKLQKSETSLREAQHLTKIGNWEFDIVKDSIYWSDEVYKIFNLEPQQFKATYQAFLDNIHPDDRDLVNKAYSDSVENRTPYNIVHRVLLKDGSEKIVNERCETFYDDTGNAIRSIGTVQDITDLKQTEKKLRENKKRFKDLAEMLPETVFEADQNLNINFANQCALELYGYTNEDFKNGFNCLNMLIPEDRERAKTNVAKRLKGKELGAVEYQGLKKDGSIFPILLHARPIIKETELIGIRGIVIDMTEHKRAEKALKESEDKYRGLFNESVAAVYIFDSEKNFIDSNQAGLELLGYSREELLCMNILDVDANQKEVKPAHNQLLSRDRIVNFEHKLKRKDGNIITVLNNSRPLKNSEGAVVSIQSTLIDITDRKHAEEALQESRTKLLQAQYVARIGDFTWDIVQDKITWSDGMYNLLKYDKSDKIDYEKINTEIRHPDDLERVTKWLMDSIASRQEILTPNEYRLICKDGKILYVQTNGKIEYRNGEAVKIFGTCTDITERKLTEKALQESEIKNTALLNAIPDMMFVISKDGTFLSYKSTSSEGFYTPPDAFIGKRLREVLPPDVAKKAEETVEEVLTTGGAHKLEYSLEMDGNNCDYEARAVCSGNKQVLFIVRNITEQKKMEETIRESEERNRHLIESVQDVIYTISSDGIITSLSPAFETATGWKINDLVGKTMEKVMHPDEIQGARKLFGELLNGQKPYVHEKKIRTKSGEYITFEYHDAVIKKDGKVVEILGCARDVTARNLADKAIRESEAKYRTLFESSSQGILVADVKAKKFLYANTAASKLFGYSTEQLETMGVESIHPTKDLPYIINEFKLQAQGYKNLTSDIPCLRRDGTKFYADISVSPTTFNGRKCNVGFFSDITDAKKFRELEARAQRLEMAGTIAGQVAHDFNNLLAPIMAYPEFIREELPYDNQAQAYLDDIEDAAMKIAEINQDLLTMGRRGHFNQDVIDLNKVVMHTAKELKSQTDTVIFEFDLSEELLNIKGGHAQIHRMLTNLLVNARDAMENVGKITIRSENFYADNTSIVFGLVPKGEYIKLTISDNGCGIPDNIVQKIFDPFFSTKTTDKKRGSGLGLSVVDAVMKDHNSYLDLNSKIGHGTSFYLYFPITREEAGEDETDRVTGGNEKILIVDDDEIQRKVSSRLLKKLGYIVNSVENGEKAIEFLQENPQDLVILDMVMPGGIDGTETYQRIREINKQQKVIILSGFSESNQVLKAQKLGAGAFVRKPVSKKVIAAAIRTELDRKVEVSKA